jgi:SAM-dependent methyltransferase
MHPATVSFLVDLNREFYQTFGAAFAATRRRIQPGVRRVLDDLAPGGAWLDLGCGSGSVAVEWARKAAEAGTEAGTPGLYWGLDFSAALLEEARQAVSGLGAPGCSLRFDRADLSAPDWTDCLEGRSFDGVFAFAALHHLPGTDLRRQLLSQAAGLLAPGGLLIHSEWQFQHSPRLMARRIPWEQAGLSAADVEPGDTLLDWRYSLPGQAETAGRRYVHLFDRDELQELAAGAGFSVQSEFESDGEGGRLALYQVWKKR